MCLQSTTPAYGKKHEILLRKVRCVDVLSLTKSIDNYWLFATELCLKVETYHFAIFIRLHRGFCTCLGE